VSAPLDRGLWRLAEENSPGDWIAHLAHNDVAGATLLTEYLLAKGHTDIGFVAGPPVRSCLLRVLGARDAMERSGHTLRYVEVTEDDTFECGRAMGAKLLAAKRRPTALFCYNDPIAIGMIRAAHDLGLDVPGDVSIVGCDDIRVASYIEPQLTTIRTPKRELGELALSLLLDPPAGRTMQQRLTGTLVERGSVAPPRKRTRGSRARPVAAS
jgi:DNA-binding LacI/PurR family transcriptional regulator